MTELVHIDLEGHRRRQRVRIADDLDDPHRPAVRQHDGPRQLTADDRPRRLHVATLAPDDCRVLADDQHDQRPSIRQQAEVSGTSFCAASEQE